MGLKLGKLDVANGIRVIQGGISVQREPIAVGCGCEPDSKSLDRLGVLVATVGDQVALGANEFAFRFL